ncbi:MAG: DEAD/DEAH box helicase [Candidatus Eisenbacteria bacterium]|nr:DEAD/DEAH box helicase [Candidatus Eisenbacteria bacterium]
MPRDPPALEEAGYTNPTPIQEQAIPHVLEGKDIMGCAQTGTGKTAAFTLPILHRLRNEEPGHIRALILVPTRELAIQVGRSIRTYAAHMQLRSTAVYGGVPMEPQEMMLRYGVDLLVATPGRLKDHMWRGNIDYRHTSVLVLDEADRMLDMGFIDAVREIVREIPAERQTLLFSATLDPEIQRLARDILHNPVRIEVAPPTSTADGVEQFLVRVDGDSKRETLAAILRDPDMDRALVFTKTKRGASSLSGYLKTRGFRCTSIHSDKTQERRLEALNAFRDGGIRILVATDIAARGLDVTGISHVVNFDIPHSPEDYVHRIGRTARAGTKGRAISIMSPEDGRGLLAIERHLGKRLPVAEMMVGGGLRVLSEGSDLAGGPDGSHGSRMGYGGRSSRGGSSSRGGRGSSGHGSSRQGSSSRGSAGRSSAGETAAGYTPSGVRPLREQVGAASHGLPTPREMVERETIAAELGSDGAPRKRRRRGGRGRRKNPALLPESTPMIAGAPGGSDRAQNGGGTNGGGANRNGANARDERPSFGDEGSDPSGRSRRRRGGRPDEAATIAVDSMAVPRTRATGVTVPTPRDGQSRRGGEPRRDGEGQRNGASRRDGDTRRGGPDSRRNDGPVNRNSGAPGPHLRRHVHAGEPARALTAKEHLEEARRKRREKEGNFLTRFIARLGLRGD